MSTWHELIIAGSDAALRGFIAGFVAGRGEREETALAADLDLEPARLADRLRELFGQRPGHLVFAPARVATLLADAIRSHGHEADLHLAGMNAVNRASFAFTVETFSPEVTALIRDRFLAGLPESVQFVELSEDERTEHGEDGPELYSPVHGYTWRVTGSVAGALGGVLEMQRRAHASEWISAQPLVIEAIPLPLSVPSGT